MVFYLKSKTLISMFKVKYLYILYFSWIQRPDFLQLINYINSILFLKNFNGYRLIII
jgi:hypothetical protein